MKTIRGSRVGLGAGISGDRGASTAALARGMTCLLAAGGGLLGPGAEGKEPPTSSGNLRAFYAKEGPAGADPAPAGAAGKTAVAPPVEKTRAGLNQSVAVSVDYFYGVGNTTIPVFFSLSKVDKGTFPSGQVFDDVPRNSHYVGTTLRYTPVPDWSFEFNYLHGNSSGNQDVAYSDVVDPELFDTRFSIKDDWYQGYVRYSLRQLSTPRFGVAVRAGISFVQTELKDATVIPPGAYTQTDESNDILGSVGVGLTYFLYRGDRFRIGLQMDLEGFYGVRTQETTEKIVAPDETTNGKTVSIDNDLYGGLGRLTGRIEYELGRSGAWRLFAEGGMQVKYTVIHYDDAGKGRSDSFDELLWGPYVKLGVRYLF